MSSSNERWIELSPEEVDQAIRLWVSTSTLRRRHEYPEDVIVHSDEGGDVTSCTVLLVYHNERLDL